ncbi:MAG: transketolase C-terminal domain-containing protein [Candidatus Omnitrophica bacterium]|nr:transketolase C-terminal domain-containing protein [Candidatus Omnitrophota bacterium]
MKRWVVGMRDAFSDALYNLARQDKDVILITSDTGAICHNEFRQKFSRQYINIGIAEQNMVGVAAGLAMSKKIVFIYGIVPFATMRCYEQIRVALSCMNLPVTIVGVGAGLDYSTLGPTHHGYEDIALMNLLPNMSVYSPSDNLMAGFMAQACYKLPGPKYVRLDRRGVPLIYKNVKQINIHKGYVVLKEGLDGYIVATGRMVFTALAAAKELSSASLSIGVIDLFRIKPLNKTMLWPVINNSRFLIALEEHFANCGIGSILAQFLAENNANIPFKAIGLDNVFCRKYGSREYLQRLNSIDQDSIVKSLRGWLKAPAGPV